MLPTGQAQRIRGKAAQKCICTGQTIHHDEREIYNLFQ